MIISDGYIHTFNPQFKNNKILNALPLTCAQPFSIILSSNKTEVGIGDILTYTAVIENHNSTKSEHFSLIASPSPNSSFICNSFTVGGLSQINSDPCKLEVNLGALNPNEKITVTLAVKVADKSLDAVTCSLSGIFDHFFPASNSKKKASICSNIISTKIHNLDTINKLSEEITSTKLNSNTSTDTHLDYKLISCYLLRFNENFATDINDIVLFDIIPNGIDAIPKSILIPNQPSYTYGMNMESYFTFIEHNFNINVDNYLDIYSILDYHNLA